MATYRFYLEVRDHNNRMLVDSNGFNRGFIQIAEEINGNLTNESIEKHLTHYADHFKTMIGKRKLFCIECRFANTISNTNTVLATYYSSTNTVIFSK